MGEKLTDKKAISIALRMAIDYEESLIEAYTDEFTRETPEQEPGVIIARRNIAAFKRVQERYGLAPSRNIDGGKRVSVLELLRETEPQQFDAGRAALSREEGR